MAAGGLGLIPLREGAPHSQTGPLSRPAALEAGPAALSTPPSLPVSRWFLPPLLEMSSSASPRGLFQALSPRFSFTSCPALAGAAGKMHLLCHHLENLCRPTRNFQIFTRTMLQALHS